MNSLEAMPRTKPVAIISGGASGIGLALAHFLAKRKFHVIVADIDEASLEQCQATFARGESVEPVRLDVTDAAAVQATITKIGAVHGRLDYVFNNAGVGGTLDVRHATMAHWRRIVDLNLMGVVHGIHAAYPLMIAQRSGHIVNTASISGLIPWPGQTLYNTTKYAVVGLSHTLRTEAARFGVKVSVICPGPVQSAIWSTPILGSRAGTAIIPAEAIPASKAAAIIWRGVQANKATIIFPRQSRISALLYRLHPGLLEKRFSRHLRRVLPG
jgi:NAD(P)-dependent dehydrogenase (short-subunit alcohol dehydrogenase family)